MNPGARTIPGFQLRSGRSSGPASDKAGTPEVSFRSRHRAGNRSPDPRMRRQPQGWAPRNSPDCAGCFTSLHLLSAAAPDRIAFLAKLQSYRTRYMTELYFASKTLHLLKKAAFVLQFSRPLRGERNRLPRGLAAWHASKPSRGARGQTPSTRRCEKRGKGPGVLDTCCNVLTEESDRERRKGFGIIPFNSFSRRAL